jgi:hypothetical protein
LKAAGDGDGAADGVDEEDGRSAGVVARTVKCWADGDEDPLEGRAGVLGGDAEDAGGLDGAVRGCVGGIESRLDEATGACGSVGGVVSRAEVPGTGTGSCIDGVSATRSTECAGLAGRTASWAGRSPSSVWSAGAGDGSLRCAPFAVDGSLPVADAA